MRYAKIRELDISNGFGIGVALFVQGCPIHCNNCFNKETWNFDGGYCWTDKTEEFFMQLIDKPYISRVSILGGEPLAKQNIEGIIDLMSKIKSRFPEKEIWLWSGYKVCKNKSDGIEIVKEQFRDVLKYVDFLIDGRFDIRQANTNLNFRGSLNQNIYQILRYKKDKEKYMSITKVGYGNIKFTKRDLLTKID